MTIDNDNKKKGLQVRRTYEDVAKAQDDLDYLILHHIKENSCLSNTEKQSFIRLVREAVGTYGYIRGFFIPKKGYPIIPMSLMKLAYQLRNSNSNKLTVIYGFFEEKVDIRELWVVFQQMLMDVIPYSIGEARRMSKETDTGHERPTAFQFSSKDFETEDDNE